VASQIAAHTDSATHTQYESYSQVVLASMT
jgi:hypothetical protein